MRKSHDESQAQAPATRSNPLMSFHQQMDSLLRDLFGEWPTAGHWPGFGQVQSIAPSMPMPKIDVRESDDEIQIVADLPGMDEKDIHVTLGENYLTIQGERKQEREEKQRDYRVMERSYGSFHRTIPVPRGVDPNKVNAEFKKGVLTVTLPKTAEAKSREKMIQIKAA